MSNQQIINPETGRKINLYGVTYYNLIKNGYKESDLLKLDKYTTQKISNQKISNQKITPHVVISNEIIINEIYKNSSTYELLTLCQTNKSMKELCKNNLNVNILKNTLNHTTLACGPSNIFIIDDNQLYGNGGNDFGQLATPKLQSTTDFIKIKISGKPLSVACSDHHTLVLTTTGLYGCGSNAHGELTGNTKHYSQFKLIQVPDYVLSIACAESMSYIVTISGLYYVGNLQNQFTKINIKDVIYVTTSITHIAIISLHGLYIKYKDSREILINIDNKNDILTVSCGFKYTIVLTTTGLYYISQYYSIHKINFNHVVKISCQNDNFYFLTKDKNVFIGRRDDPTQPPTKLKEENIIDIVSSHEYHHYIVMKDSHGCFYAKTNQYKKLLDKIIYGDGCNILPKI